MGTVVWLVRVRRGSSERKVRLPAHLTRGVARETLLCYARPTLPFLGNVCVEVFDAPTSRCVDDPVMVNSYFVCTSSYWTFTRCMME